MAGWAVHCDACSPGGPVNGMEYQRQKQADDAATNHVNAVHGGRGDMVQSQYWDNGWQ